jgi:hypothetical protein
VVRRAGYFPRTSVGFPAVSRSRWFHPRRTDRLSVPAATLAATRAQRRDATVRCRCGGGGRMAVRRVQCFRKLRATASSTKRKSCSVAPPSCSRPAAWGNKRGNKCCSRCVRWVQPHGSRKPNPYSLDIMDTPSTRLRALWGVSPVGVRVSLGASKSPANAGFFRGAFARDVVEHPAVATAWQQTATKEPRELALRSGFGGLSRVALSGIREFRFHAKPGVTVARPGPRRAPWPS